jgi:glycosyltransferase involved in cell wall biosynthesis
MNIGIVTTWFERGAAYVSRQYRMALEPKHTCFIYARGGEVRTRKDSSWDDPHVTWGKPGVMPVETSMDLADFARWIETNKLDIVWFNEQYWWEPVLLCHRMGIKTGGYMVTYREDEIPLHGSFDFLTCNTRQYYDVFKWHPQAHFLPWGTDLNVFKPQSLDPVEPGKVTFFHSAGLNPHRKGTWMLVRAFSRLDDRAKLVIHSQVPLEKYLKEEWGLVEKLLAEKRLTLHIGTVGAPGLFHLGDVYVYPTLIDSLGLTVAEALGCGLPVVIPDNAPMTEFMDETCGRKVRIARYYSRTDGHYWPQCLVDEDDLVAKMQEYVDRADKIGELKRAARAYAEKNLSWGEHMKRIPEVFESARKLTPAENQQWLDLTAQYELARARQNPRAWVSHHQPWAIKWMRNVTRLVRH